MVKITCHNDNIPERQYAIDALFSELLGFNKDEYNVCFEEDACDYSIQKGNRTIIVEDHFFRFFPEALSYLDLNHTPSELQFFHFGDSEIPIIYGVDKYVESNRGIVIGLDVFASTFFMLSRWEEFLLGREEKGDCDESLLFAVKNEIHRRPIVHEYESLLRSVLELSRTQRQYQVVLSHDVDGFLTPSYCRIVSDFLRQSIKGTPKNKILNLTWRDEIRYKKAYPSAYSQFYLFRMLSNKYGVPEWMYFKVCDKGEKECTYRFNDSIVSNVVNRLMQMEGSNLQLGFHPSQSTFRNPQQWDTEVNRIKYLIGRTPRIGRNHHLLFDMQMLRAWEALASSNDVIMLSNVVFHKRHGFRSGVAVPYPVFDIFQRRPMRIFEHPCQIMDTVLRYDSERKSEFETMEEIKEIVSRTREHQGMLLLTWHIYIRNVGIIDNYYRWCDRIIEYAVNG